MRRRLATGALRFYMDCLQKQFEVRHQQMSMAAFSYFVSLCAILAAERGRRGGACWESASGSVSTRRVCARGAAGQPVFVLRRMFRNFRLTVKNCEPRIAHFALF